MREALAALPAQQVINSEADALTLAVHATLELDGKCLCFSAQLARLRKDVRELSQDATLL